MLDAINAVNAGRQGGIGAVIGLLVGVTIAVIWSLNEAPAGCQPSDFGFDFMNITFRCAGEGPIIVGLPNTPSHPISLAVLAFVGNQLRDRRVSHRGVVTSRTARLGRHPVGADRLPLVAGSLTSAR